MTTCGRELGTWIERCPFWRGEAMQSTVITGGRHVALLLTVLGNLRCLPSGPHLSVRNPHSLAIFLLSLPD